MIVGLMPRQDENNMSVSNLSRKPAACSCSSQHYRHPPRFATTTSKISARASLLLLPSCFYNNPLASLLPLVVSFTQEQPISLFSHQGTSSATSFFVSGAEVVRGGTTSRSRRAKTPSTSHKTFFHAEDGGAQRVAHKHLGRADHKENYPQSRSNMEDTTSKTATGLPTPSAPAAFLFASRATASSFAAKRSTSTLALGTALDQHNKAGEGKKQKLHGQATLMFQHPENAEKQDQEHQAHAEAASSSSSKAKVEAAVSSEKVKVTTTSGRVTSKAMLATSSKDAIEDAVGDSAISFNTGGETTTFKLKDIPWWGWAIVCFVLVAIIVGIIVCIVRCCCPPAPKMELVEVRS
ncbi:unnamed protein product [Amoebophrya sp. A120]|nr:unnamed protein product [Amoebophrya sp. A120]|eukprot:GSA120T00013409001.1